MRRYGLQILTVFAFAIGLITNAWHKNATSGLVISISAIAIGVWLGTALARKV